MNRRDFIVDDLHLYHESLSLGEYLVLSKGPFRVTVQLTPQQFTALGEFLRLQEPKQAESTVVT